MTNQLTAKGLKKSFRSRHGLRTAVKDVSIDVASGEMVGLLGPNGAGKTTTFYMLVGLVAPDDGDIRLNGTTITQAKIHERAHLGLGYLPQEASIFRKLTVRENLLAILELNQTLTSTEAQNERLEALLEQFQLHNIAEQKGTSLSGGERRRVELARALALNPKFLLLDEPFAGVDPITIVEIKHHLHQLARQGIGILITDHNVRETLTLCERAYIIHHGQVLCAGTPNTILNHPEVRAVYLGEQFSL